MIRRYLVVGMVAGLSLVALGSTVGQAQTSSGATVKTLAQGPVKNLPAGKVFINVLEFRQVPGADYGPHAHVPGFVYTLHGNSTLSFPQTAPQSLGPGDAAFIPALVAHTHVNSDGRVGAAAIAVGLILVAVLLCAATLMRGGRRRAVIAVLSLSLVAGGTLPLIGATSNDFYFISVRPESQRAAPMPRPDGRVAYTSPSVNPVPAGPYMETLRSITVPPGGRYDALDLPGPEVILVEEGTATVHVGAVTQQLGGGSATLAQRGETFAIVNAGSDTIRVIDFAVTSQPAVPAAT
jgi:quercetin dioxygenase-like cupin family protein